MKQLFEYDLYFPIGAGSTERSAELESLKRRLTDFFGGLTDFRHRSHGEWKIGGVVYHDEILLLRMIGDNKLRSREFLRGVAAELATALGEKEILIVEREVQAL